jgi:type II secretory pathway pseudopilin PulG
MNRLGTHSIHTRRATRGFTLTELLVVIGIIILVTLLAIPAFRAMTGNRSTEAAQNQISGYLTRARTEALGLEEPRGVLFYRDLESKRIGMIVVRPLNTEAPWQLDMVPDRDPMLLPNGVGIQFIDNYTSTAGRRSTDGYIGFNTRVASGAATNETRVPYGGVILFDKQGRVTSDTYAFRNVHDADGAGPVAAKATELGRFLYDDPKLGTGGTALLDLTDAVGDEPQAKLGFVLFDAEEFNNLFGSSRATAKNTDTDTQVSGTMINGTFAGTPTAPEEREEEEWLDNNAVPLLVNRYNGTLVRGE